MTPRRSRKYRTTTIVVALALIASCGGSCCQDPLARERKELRETLESSSLIVYRSIKVVLRGIPLDVGNLIDLTDDELKARLATKKTMLDPYSLLMGVRIARSMQGKGEPFKLGLKEGIVLAASLSAMKKRLRTIDEDDLPTVFEILTNVFAQKAIRPNYYTPALEHVILSVAWAAGKGPPEFTYYEITQARPTAKDHALPRLFVHLFKGALFLKREWPHMAELEFTAYLETCKSNAASVAELLGEDARTASIVGYVGRGIVRQDIGKDEESLADFDMALAEYKRIGRKDELYAAIGLYVSLKRNKNDEALNYIRVLEEQKLSESDRRLVAQAKSYVLERENGKALNSVFDKIFLGKLVLQKVILLIHQSKYYRDLEASEEGRQIIGAPEKLEEVYQTIQDKTGVSKLKSLGKEAKDKAAEKLKGLFRSKSKEEKKGE